MRKRIVSVGMATLFGLTAVGVLPAHAATHYANCTALHKHYRYGVARSAKAATYQVNTGHYRPHVSASLYAANSGSDRDKDGTACEVTR
jgi:hypothetical protein